MSRIFQALALLFVFCSIAPMSADADGGTHTQSPLMCGVNFDYTSQTSSDSIGSCAYAEVGTNGFPLSTATATTLTLVFPQNQTQKLTLTSCQDAQTDAYQVCTADRAVCQPPSPKTSPKTSPAFSPNANRVLRWSASKSVLGTFTVEMSTVTVACAVPEDDTAKEATGAIGKCIEWFKYDFTQGINDTFQACLRNGTR